MPARVLWANGRKTTFVFFAINRNPGYTFVYVRGSWQATRHVAPFVRIDNALNADYQEVLGYSALSRNAAGGVRLTW
jgi:outer membrane cobalamin receptor